MDGEHRKKSDENRRGVNQQGCPDSGTADARWAFWAFRAQQRSLGQVGGEADDACEGACSEVARRGSNPPKQYKGVYRDPENSRGLAIEVERAVAVDCGDGAGREYTGGRVMGAGAFPQPNRGEAAIP